MNKNFLSLFCFLSIATALFGQMPNQDQVIQAGKDMVEKMAQSIGEPLPNNAIKMGENTYQLKSDNDGMEGLTEVFYTNGNIVTGHGYINMTQYEDISNIMFMTFCSGLSAYLGDSTPVNSIYSWNYKTKKVNLSSPQYRNNAWVVMLIMVENINVSTLDTNLIESLKSSIGMPVPVSAQRVAWNYFVLSEETTNSKISGRAFTIKNDVVTVAEYKWIRLSRQDLLIIEEQLYKMLDVYGEPKNNGTNLVYPSTDKYIIMVKPTYHANDQFILELAIMENNS